MEDATHKEGIAQTIRDQYDGILAPLASEYTPKVLLDTYAPFRRARRFLHSDRAERSPDHGNMVDSWEQWHALVEPRSDGTSPCPLAVEIQNLVGGRLTDQQIADLNASVLDDAPPPEIAGMEKGALNSLVSHHRIADGAAIGFTLSGAGHSAALGREQVRDDPDSEIWSFFAPHHALDDEFEDRDPHTLYEWKIAITRRTPDISDDPDDVLAFASGIAIDPTAAKDPKWFMAEAGELTAWEEYRRLALQRAAKAEGMGVRLFREMASLASALHVRQFWVAPKERGGDRLVQLFSGMRTVLYAGFSRVDARGLRIYSDHADAEIEMDEMSGQSSTFGFELPYVPRRKSDRAPDDVLEAMRRMQWIRPLERHITSCARKAGIHVVYWPDGGD